MLSQRTPRPSAARRRAGRQWMQRSLACLLFVAVGIGAAAGQNLYVDSSNPGKGGIYAGSSYSPSGTVHYDNVYVGYNGTGTIFQFGGRISGSSSIVASQSVILASRSGSEGRYEMEGGTLAARSLTSGAGTSTFDLAGGTFTVRSVRGGTGTSTFDFDGGTLQAGASDGTDASGKLVPFFSGLTTVNDTGGAVVDTNGHDDTIATALVHGTGTAFHEGGLVKSGAGTLTLSGANTYAGQTLVGAGTLRAGIGTTAFGNGSAVTLANVAGATLDLAGHDETIGSLAGGGNAGGNVTLGKGTLTTGGNRTDTAFAGTISGTGGLVKTGAGAFRLTGTNNFTGATQVQAGTLAIDGLFTSPAEITVARGATLEGNGNIYLASATVAAGAFLAPGNDGSGDGGTGHLSVGGNLFMTTGATLEIDLNGTMAGDGYSQLDVLGRLDLAGAKLRLTLGGGFQPMTGEEFDIASAGLGLHGRFAGGTTVTDDDGDTYLITYTENSAILTALTAVPEPGTWTILAAGAGGVYLVRRRQRSKTG